MDATGLRGRMSPDPSVAIGLKFQSHRTAVRTHASGTNALIGAEQVLHVMSELVRNDVGLGEIAGRAESLREFVEETEIEIDLLVSGTVERACRTPRRAAAGLDTIAEQHHTR